MTLARYDPEIRTDLKMNKSRFTFNLLNSASETQYHPIQTVHSSIIHGIQITGTVYKKKKIKEKYKNEIYLPLKMTVYASNLR